MAEIQTQATPEQVAEIKAAQGLKQLSFREDGVYVEDTPASVYKLIWGDGGPKGGQSSEADEEENRSYGLATLLEFRTRRGEHVQPLRLELPKGGVFEANVRTLNMTALLTVGVCMARDGYGLHDLTSEGAQVSLHAALFFVGLAKAGDENEPLFGSPDEASQWMHEPGFVEIPLYARSVLFQLNPLLPKVCGESIVSLMLSPVE